MADWKRAYTVRWGDLDANGHMRNTAFLDIAVETRLACFAANGFTTRDFAAAGIGPVSLKDEMHYRRELRFQEPFEVDVALGGMSEDGVRMRVVNVLYRGDGAPCAVVSSEGVWFDLRARKPTRPPDALIAVLEGMPRTADFEVLEGPPPGPRPPGW